MDKMYARRLLAEAEKKIKVPAADYISALKDFLATLIYKWRQGMCRMFQNKRTGLLKITGCMSVRLISSATRKAQWLLIIEKELL